ncbi:MAG: hypothetical protein R3309_09340, partial [Reinekea sp.]|nr:hypothetical protein [Reinekea sp.]
LKDVDLAMKSITDRNGKGLKARVVPIPESLLAPLQSVMIHRKELHIQDTLQGAGYVHLPWAFERKSPKAAQGIQWQFFVWLWRDQYRKEKWPEDEVALLNV